jgi:hypothetical protein
MTQQWSLETLLEGLHDEIHQKLEFARKALAHPVSKGDASEKIWLELLNEYLPKRYQAQRAFVVDSKGNFSEQIDVVIYDRQYSPFIFKFNNEIFVPAESVYAVFEAKQTINANYIQYTDKKIRSVQSLHRTSLPIPHAGGTFPAKIPSKIIGGILAFESDWTPAFGSSLKESLKQTMETINLGCVAAHGYFSLDNNLKQYEYKIGGKPATAFLFKLISILQYSGTVPMIDILAYSNWLNLSTNSEVLQQ